MAIISEMWHIYYEISDFLQLICVLLEGVLAKNL